MDELERKLRSALTEMAEEVSPSHHAWAEQERRLALKSRRDRVRPALMAAVAAAVVALIAVPVVVLNSRTGHVQEGTAPMPPDTGSPRVTPSPDGQPQQQKIPYRSLNGETLTAGPMIVGATGSPGNTVYTYSYAIRSEKGNAVCFAKNTDGNEINGSRQAEYGSPACTSIVKPKHGLFWGMVPVPAGNAGGTYVYAMGAPADKLLLRDVNERLVVAGQRTDGEEFVLFAAYMESKAVPKAWTVKDAAGKDLQHGP